MTSAPGSGVLAVLNLEATAAAVLRTAGLLAARLGLAASALHVVAPDGHVAGEELVTGADLARHRAATAERRAMLRAAAAEAGLAAALREVAGPTRRTVATAAAGAALVVLGRAPAMFYEDAEAALHGALLDAGAAVVLPGETPPSGLGAHIALAWKPGAPAEGALTAALPLLRLASRVTLLIATEGADETPPPLDLPHATHRFLAEGSVGTALLREAAGLGADMMVMGAFSRGRMREAIFGGATRDVLLAGALPVLLRH